MHFRRAPLVAPVRRAPRRGGVPGQGHGSLVRIAEPHPVITWMHVAHHMPTDVPGTPPLPRQVPSGFSPGAQGPAIPYTTCFGTDRFGAGLGGGSGGFVAVSGAKIAYHMRA
jgi:hypothetical protein